MDWYVANPDLSEDGVMAFYWVETWSSTKIASHLPVIRNLVVLCCQKEVMMNAQISSLGGETILALGVSKQMSWTRQLPDTFIPQVYLHVCWYRIPICCWSMFITIVTIADPKSIVIGKDQFLSAKNICSRSAWLIKGQSLDRSRTVAPGGHARCGGPKGRLHNF